jgi:hypothetical protein
MSQLDVGQESCEHSSQTPLLCCTELSQGILSYIQSFLTTDGQSASLSYYWVTIRDPLSILFSLPCKIFSDIYGVATFCAPSTTRGRVCNFCVIATGPCRRCHSGPYVPQNSWPYATVSHQTMFPFCRLLHLEGLRWRNSIPFPC